MKPKFCETSLIDKQQMCPLVSNFIQRRPFVTFDINQVAWSKNTLERKKLEKERNVIIKITSLIDKQQMRPLVSNFIQRRPFVTFNINIVA